MKLNEDIFIKGRIVESDSAKLPKGVLCRVVYPISNIGERNQNHRVYSKALWEKVLSNDILQRKMKERTLFGQAEHPAETQSDLQLTSHIITKTWIDESANKVMQEMDVLNTPCGKIINTLLEANCLVGVSTRAEGELEEVTEGTDSYYNVLAESYNYVTTDFTADPSTFNVTPQKYERNIVKEIRQGLNSKKLDKHFAMVLLESMQSKDAKQMLESMKETKVSTVLNKKNNKAQAKLLGERTMISSGSLKGIAGKIVKIKEDKVTIELDNGATIVTDTSKITMDNVEVNVTPVGGGNTGLDVQDVQNVPVEDVKDELDQVDSVDHVEDDDKDKEDWDVDPESITSLDKDDLDDELFLEKEANESKKLTEMSTYTRVAQTDEQERSIRSLEKTLAKFGKRLVGGTTIGKSPQTVVLDLTRQGSEIYVDSNGQVKIKGHSVNPRSVDDVEAAVGGAERNESKVIEADKFKYKFGETDKNNYEEFKKAVGVTDEKEARRLWKDFRSFTDFNSDDGESARIEAWMRKRLPKKYESKINETEFDGRYGDDVPDTANDSDIPEEILADAKEMVEQDALGDFQDVVDNLLQNPKYLSWFKKEYQGNEYDLRVELEDILISEEYGIDESKKVKKFKKKLSERKWKAQLPLPDLTDLLEDDETSAQKASEYIMDQIILFQNSPNAKQLDSYTLDQLNSVLDEFAMVGTDTDAFDDAMGIFYDWADENDVWLDQTSVEESKKVKKVKEGTTGQIIWASPIQKLLWDNELSGQVSDGYWENARPSDHYKSLTGADTSYSSNEEEQGRLGVYLSRKYNFANSDLLEVVGDRMIAGVRLSIAFPEIPRNVLRHAEYVVDPRNKDSIINPSNERDKYWEKLYTDIQTAFGITDEQSYTEVMNKINSVPYDMRALRKDLNQMSKIIQKVSGKKLERNESLFATIRDLRISEAGTVAEKEKAIELLEEAEHNYITIVSGKTLESKMLSNRLTDSQIVESSEVTALRKKLEEKSKGIAALKAQVQELKESYAKDLDRIKAEVESYKQEVTKSVKESQDKLKKESLVLEDRYRHKFIKQYVSMKLESSGWNPHASTRALLEKKTTVKEVDECYNELLDVMRQNALHSNQINEVTSNKTTANPEVKRIANVVNGLNF